MTESLVELRAREAEAEREWLWLVEALNTIVRARAEQGEAHAFRLMQQQAMRVGHGARGGRSVDPSGSSHSTSSEVGIVVCGSRCVHPSLRCIRNRTLRLSR